MNVVYYESLGKFHYYNKRYHRIDGPAIEYKTGGFEYYYNGTLHRLGGPAIGYTNGEKRWFIKGKEVTKETHDFHYGRRLTLLEIFPPEIVDIILQNE